MSNPRQRGIPTWFASAPHGRYVLSSGAVPLWRPYGIHHARQVGASRTACGRGALGWELFWEVPFPDYTAETCRECALVVAAWREPTPGSMVIPTSREVAPQPDGMEGRAQPARRRESA